MTKRYCKENGLRTMAFAYREMDRDTFDRILQAGNDQAQWHTLLQDMVFLAMVGLQDPLKENTEQLVKFVAGDVDVVTEEDLTKKRKNITMRIVSGDHIETVRNVAMKAGIIAKESNDDVRASELYESMPNSENYQRAGVPACINAEELFDRCHGIDGGKPGSMQEFRKLMNPESADTLKVIARANNEHKQAIIAGLREMDKKVIYVGNGLHDIDAQLSADVSFAMGGGCALARWNSTMTLITDEFKSLAKSILWGRNIYQNVKRFLTFQLSCNFSALLVVFIGQFYLSESPLNAIQLLWINLIMDTMAALALATTPPFTKVMQQGVYSNETVLNKIDWRHIFTMTIWTVIIMVIVIFAGKGMYDLPYPNTVQAHENENKKTHLTIIFDTFVYLQFFNMINCRVVGARDFNVFTRFFVNFYQLFILLLIFGLQWSINTSLLSWLFGTTQLTQKEFWSTVVLGMSALIPVFLVKLTPTRWAEEYIKPLTDETQEINKGSGLMKVYKLSQRKFSTVIKAEPGVPVVPIPVNGNFGEDNSPDPLSSQNSQSEDSLN